MLAQLKAMSITRICASAALAVLALLLIVLCAVYSIRALYFIFQLHMTANAAAAVTAGFCLLLAVIFLLLARIVLLQPSSHKAATPKAEDAPTDIGTHIGLMLAREVEHKIQQHPKNSVALSALSGLILGAAPKETAAVFSAILRSFETK